MQHLLSLLQVLKFYTSAFNMIPCAQRHFKCTKISDLSFIQNSGSQDAFF